LFPSLPSVKNLIIIIKNATEGKLEKFDVLYISKANLIRAKKEAGRAKDIADVKEL